MTAGEISFLKYYEWPLEGRRGPLTLSSTIIHSWNAPLFWNLHRATNVRFSPKTSRLIINLLHVNPTVEKTKQSTLVALRCLTSYRLFHIDLKYNTIIYAGMRIIGLANNWSWLPGFPKHHVLVYTRHWLIRFYIFEQYTQVSSVTPVWYVGNGVLTNLSHTQEKYNYYNSI